MIDSTPANTLKTYLDRHFVPFDELVALGGLSPAATKAMIAARAIPGPIYTLWPNGAHWSAIGGSHGGAPGGEPSHWYSPAAAWWIRRGHGLTPEAAALTFEQSFVSDFVSRLAAEPQGPLGYPQVYASGVFLPHLAESAGRAEWRDWLDGGYGVCLRHANAQHVIVKTCRRAAIVALTDEGRATQLGPERTKALLTLLEELEAVMLPFAPHQRQQGTPGLWIDAILARYGLGRTREQVASLPSTPRDICA